MEGLLILFGVVIVLGFVVVALLFHAFILMVCLGALSHIFDVDNLAIGYLPSILVSIIAGVLLSPLISRGDK